LVASGEAVDKTKEPREEEGKKRRELGTKGKRKKEKPPNYKRRKTIKWQGIGGGEKG